MNILETLAVLSRERAEADQAAVPAELLREQALALGPGEGGSAWAYYALTAGPLAGVALKPKRK